MSTSQHDQRASFHRFLANHKQIESFQVVQPNGRYRVFALVSVPDDIRSLKAQLSRQSGYDEERFEILIAPPRLHNVVCPDCVGEKHAFNIVPAMRVPDDSCKRCYGSGKIPANLQTIEERAVQIAKQIPLRLRNADHQRSHWRMLAQGDFEVEIMNCVTELQALEDEYYLQGGQNFPV
ncbi:hypothetical protein [Rhizobium sp. 9140]|uniref:hypothetical protein n=1 Tax=Rhizobium sp. 9140 TaxID=1761900 RepID=UPI0011123B8C|nr:hypothetical protein [Rhizobium sp. 9140]